MESAFRSQSYEKFKQSLSKLLEKNGLKRRLLVYPFKLDIPALIISSTSKRLLAITEQELRI